MVKITNGENMTIEEIEREWEKDHPINETDLGAEARNIPKLHSKYYKMYVRAALKLKKLKADLVELEKDKKDYYNGSMSREDLTERGWKPYQEKLLRVDIPKYIESDKDVQELSLKIGYLSEVVKYLEEIIRNINNRNFLLKTILDYNRFTSGG
jgi:hypothetical protein